MGNIASNVLSISDVASAVRLCCSVGNRACARLHAGVQLDVRLSFFLGGGDKVCIYSVFLVDSEFCNGCKLALDDGAVGADTRCSGGE